MGFTDGLNGMDIDPDPGSNAIICPNCGRDFTYYQVIVSSVGLPAKLCPFCNFEILFEQIKNLFINKDE